MVRKAQAQIREAHDTYECELIRITTTPRNSTASGNCFACKYSSEWINDGNMLMTRCLMWLLHCRMPSLHAIHAIRRPAVPALVHHIQERPVHGPARLLRAHVVRRNSVNRGRPRRATQSSPGAPGAGPRSHHPRERPLPGALNRQWSRIVRI